jgi:hypothetical protein
MASAALVNYGQRADLLRNLIDGRADLEAATDRDYWVKQMKRLATATRDTSR